MKTYLKIYAKTFTLILFCYIIISIILATLISFMQISNLIYNISIQTLSSLVMIISGLYFYKQIPNKLLYHSILFAFLYLLLTLIVQFNTIHLLTLFIRPLLFIITSLILSYIGK